MLFAAHAIERTEQTLTGNGSCHRTDTIEIRTGVTNVHASYN